MYQNVIKLAANPQSVKAIRRISNSAVCSGRLTSNRSVFWEKRGNTRFQELRKKSKDPRLAYHDYGDRKPGITGKNGEFQVIPELIPDIVVPDLTDFQLKPYISYRAPDVKREEFTSKQLFTAVYQEKIVDDFNNNGLLEDGTPKVPSFAEKMTPEEAYQKARQTGSDIFAEDPKEPDPIERIIYRK